MARLEGIINLSKPVGISSAKAVYRVRSITGQRKSGHAGALDPGAAGVLIVCLGRATKLVERVMDQPKVYRATARLDVTSESFDADRPLQPVEVAHAPTGSEVRAACAGFEGTIQQIPPRISAVKVAGRAAYKHAHCGQDIELSPRPVTVYWIRVHRYDWPELDFEMACGRGTYVRALIRDLGEKLGTGGCLTSLIRSRVGPFTLDESWTFDALAAADSGDYLLDVERALKLFSGPPSVPRRSEVPEL